MMSARRTWPTVVALAAACFLALAAGVSCSQAPDLAPPERAIQSLLELRAERSTDASAYAEFLGTTDLAIELARASAEETSDAPPTPPWEPPYVAAETSATTEVVVVWKDRQTFSDWPPATIFTMEARDGGWVAIDARSVEATEEVPPRGE